MGKLRISRVDRKPEAKGIDIHHPTAKFLPTIELVYQRKVLDTRHIALLTGDVGIIDAKTKKRRYVATTNRLRKLLDNGYLVRWEAQRPDRFNPSNNKHLFHFIGKEAVSVLEAHFPYAIAKSDYERVKSRADAWHDWWISELYVRFTIDAKQRAVSYLPCKDFIQGAVSPTVKEKFPFTQTRWRLAGFTLEKTGDKEKRLMPDDVFALVAGKTHLFLLEVDRDTEDNEHQNPDQAALKRKWEGYIKIFRERTYTKAYGIDNMRVLVVTSSQRRIENNIQIIREKLGFMEPLFYFSTFKTIQGTPNILDLRWKVNTGEYRTIP
jgi:hypothetical protein